MPPAAPPIVRKPTGLNIDEVGPIRLAPDVYWRITSVNEVWNVETTWLSFAHNATGLTATHLPQVRILADRLKSEPDCRIEMYGLADTTGTNSVNFAVAGKRLSSVQAGLRAAGAPGQKVFDPAHKNLGEEFAGSKIADETPDPSFRRVSIYVWTDEIARGLLFNDTTTNAGKFLKFARNFKR